MLTVSLFFGDSDALFNRKIPFCTAFTSGNLRIHVSVNFSSGKVDT